MTEEDKKLLSDLDFKLKKLIEANGILKVANAKLEQQVKDKNDSIAKLQNDFEVLKTSYTNLKQARIISINDSEVKDTKQRLSRLVREVDKCIALLSE